MVEGAMDILDAKKVHSLTGGASFTLRHRLLRQLWAVVWGIFASRSPVPMHGWRRFILRCFGARIHPTARVYPSAKVWFPPNLIMGEHSCLGPDVNCYCMNTIELGKFALVSQGAHLCGGTHDIDDPNFQLISKPIKIGDRAWVAAEAFVGPGVTLGPGAVLGARAVTFKNLDPNMVYAGSPARPIRVRLQKGRVS